MSDVQTLDESPAEGAPVEVESPTTPAEATDKQPTDDAGSERVEQPRDEKGRFESVQARIDKVTWEKYEAQRQADYYRQQLEQFQQKQAPQPAAAPEKPPTLEAFGYDEAKYQQAVIDFATKQALAVVDSRLNERTEQERAAQRQQTFESRQAEFAKTVEDYQAVVLRPDLPINANMAEDIAESENGPALAYYLGKNPDVARQIAALPARAASRELGKIEAKLTAPKAAPPAVTKAPAPPPKIPVSSDTGISVKPTESDSDKAMSDAEWIRAREKQLQRKAQGK